MIIEYEGIRGLIVGMKQVNEDKYYFKIRLLNESTAKFETSIFNIKIIDCVGNEKILSKVKKGD